MHVSQKCQYALRAIFELTKRAGEGPVKIGDIAQAQAIPQRFLEVILSQLKQGGFVESRRGAEGGYFLVRPGDGLTVGEIVRFVEGPMSLVDCVTAGGKAKCPMDGTCVFMPIWERVEDAVSEVYDNTTFQYLVEEEERMRMSGNTVLNYSI